MEIKKEGEKLVLYDGDRNIETYELGKEIDFSKLAEILLEKDFESKIDLVDGIEEKTEQEKNIVTFILKILEDYNKKVDLFKSYISELKDKEK